MNPRWKVPETVIHQSLGIPPQALAGVLVEQTKQGDSYLLNPAPLVKLGLYWWLTRCLKFPPHTILAFIRCPEVQVMAEEIVEPLPLQKMVTLPDFRFIAHRSFKDRFYSLELGTWVTKLTRRAISYATLDVEFLMQSWEDSWLKPCEIGEIPTAESTQPSIMSGPPGASHVAADSAQSEAGPERSSPAPE